MSIVRTMLAALRTVGTTLCLLVVAACAGPAATEPAPFRFGVAQFADVDPLQQADAIAAMGFDYLEPGLARTVALTEAQRDDARHRLQRLGIRVEGMNWFLPPELKVTGPAVDPIAVRAYVEQALGVAESFGASFVVFGSPASRSHPADFPRARAWQQLVEFLRLCGDVIEQRGFGMVVAIEALRRPETNLVNTVAEALQLARDVGHAKVRIVVDFYHLAFENEDPDIVLQARDWLVHVQIAEPGERGYPLDATREPRYARFFGNLRRIGYRGGISLEGKPAAFTAEAPRSLQLLRTLAAAAPAR